MTVFRLPDVGEGLHEAEIVSWYVGAGDHVVADQPLVSVETDKAVVEIPSPHGGHIAELHAEVGDVIEIGEPLVSFADTVAPDSGTVVGEIPTTASEASPRAVVPSVGARGRGRATPAVRELARRRGVDLSRVEPTGPDGTVSRADVERAAVEAPTSPPVGARDGIEPLRGVRRAMAANMARAHAEVVPATVTDLASVGSWPARPDVTLRLVRAVVAACQVEPALNASFLGPEIGRRTNDHVDLGIATDTEDGLFVPVLRNAANRESADLRNGLETLKADVAARRIPPEELRGQTITLSNFGMYGGRFAVLVVVPPQVAIVGAGRIHDDGNGPVLPLSLTFDHRVVTGVEATRFLATAIADLEQAR